MSTCLGDCARTKYCWKSLIRYMLRFTCRKGRLMSNCLGDRARTRYCWKSLTRRMRRRIRVTRVIFFSSMTTLLVPPRANTLGPAACACASGACLRRSGLPCNGLPQPQWHQLVVPLVVPQLCVN